MFFSLAVALWMTYGVAGSDVGPFVPLRFIREPTDTVALRSEPITLNCLAEGSPSPTKITWEKDGQQIDTDSRRRILSNGTLFISQIIHIREYKPDVGEYRCFVWSPAGRIASRKVHLDVAGISKKFLYEPQSTTTWVGSIAHFVCQVLHAVPPATITWEKDGMPLRSNGRRVILTQGVLQIKEVQKADEGNYRCIARNVGKTRYSQAASLVVQTGSPMDKVALQFLGMPHNATVLKGGTTVLECAATGYPVPVITWQKLNGNPQIFNSTRGVSNLKFTKVTEHDGGEYECRASSNGQTISRTVWLFVTVPPKFTKQPKSLQLTTDGPTRLHCEVTGSPLPSLLWLKNGNELVSSGKTQIAHYSGGTHLTISNVGPSDEGIYQCFAENKVGSIQTSASVIFHSLDNKPGPPTNVVALPYSSSSILLSWSPPQGNYKITAYTVHFQKHGEAEQQNVVGNETHTHIIEDLQGFTNYSLYIRAITNANLGRKSTPVVQRTLEGRPDSPPMNVKVTSNTPDSLDVEWQPPPKDDQNGIITTYVIKFNEHSNRALPTTLEVPAYTLNTTINGLSKGKTYSVQVSAATAVGKGEWSQPVTGTVLNQTKNVISAPTLWIAGQNSTVLRVKWLPPQYGKESLKEYRLFYVQLQSSKIEKGPFIIGKQYNSYFLTGLSSGTEFLIKLMAWDGRRLGQPGAVRAVTNKDPHAIPDPKEYSRTPPSRPINLKCTVESPTSILLTWEKRMSAERIAYYTVKYHPKHSLNPHPKESKVYTESKIINKLRPGKEYTIFVQSHYEKKTTDYPSELSTTQTYCFIPLQGLSSPPRNVHFEYKSPRSVDIVWEKPSETNGELTSYEIIYSYNSSLPDYEWMKDDTPLGVFGSKKETMRKRLTGIKENTTFYLKIRAENQEGYGPFCNTVTIRPPKSVLRVSPNISYTIVSPRLVKLSWTCPQVYNALVERFIIHITNNKNDPEGTWDVWTLGISSPMRCPKVVTTTIAVQQHKIYFIKVRAEYDDQIPGKWSNIVEISTGSSSTKDPRISEMDKDPDFKIKLGIIIGCTVSAFFIVVLGLFITWRNPCRQPLISQGKEKAPSNAPPPLNGLLPHHQQILASGKHDNSASTEETSASSGICRCRCTCGAASKWPTGSAMIRTKSKLQGSSDSSTPITRVFASTASRGVSEESVHHQDDQNKSDVCNPASSSSSISVEMYRNEKISAIPVMSISYKQSIAADV